MGNQRARSRGLRHGTRNMFTRGFRQNGPNNATTYLRTFRVRRRVRKAFFLYFLTLSFAPFARCVKMGFLSFLLGERSLSLSLCARIEEAKTMRRWFQGDETGVESARLGVFKPRERQQGRFRVFLFAKMCFFFSFFAHPFLFFICV